MGDWAVIWASRNGHLDVVKFLVSVGSDIHAMDSEAIIYTSSNGHLDVVKFLCSKGVNTDYIFYDMKIEIFGSKMRDFYRRQRDRKKIENMLKVLTPLYYEPLNKGGYFAKKEISDFITNTF